MTDADYAVVLFHSSSHALRAEKFLVEAGFICKLIPVPRQLSSDCGVCLRIPGRESESVRETLEKLNVEYADLCAIES
ncbi:MAG: DUF3343 domain-containing protein [Candidatus Eisenbacteria bacterium]|uniref:DUF3343 domain-containing protein n=1 Tax=Eiseniibacteriota bacterium TaxID=2212470 RepID=A0A948W4D3_UNCEI|nr:DUF3343 domain-containing protein [Candidatus Eisenbacteria bacterium]MBU1949259.1 DUF3343 domain-containing protein [Candidatus Eisenbacteria bacterium]MBU2692092.1 DUF3343 domain-containing protein [Candidatus Eisenbacteria bacterium]